MNWVEIPAGKYTITPADSRRSHCQLEVTVRWKSFDSASFHIVNLFCQIR